MENKKITVIVVRIIPYYVILPIRQTLREILFMHYRDMAQQDILKSLLSSDDPKVVGM